MTSGSQAWRDYFLVHAWEQFNESMGLPASLWFGDGWWSDSALLIRDGIMPTRAADPATQYGQLVAEGPRGKAGQYGQLVQAATSLLPCSLPAVNCYLHQNRHAFNGAIIEDQTGHRAYIKYGYLSLLRTMCPQVALRVVPRRAFARISDTKVLLTDPAGELVGILMQVAGWLRPQDGVDGPLPTGLEPVDPLAVRRAEKAVRQLKAQRALEAARGQR
jgi:hypothetical protein